MPCQGESDANSTADATSLPGKFAAMVAAVRCAQSMLRRGAGMRFPQLLPSTFRSGGSAAASAVCFRLWLHATCWGGSMR